MSFRHGNSMRQHESFLRAQRRHDNAAPDDDDLHGDAVDALVSDAKWRAAHVAEADEWVDGTFDGEHYSAVERALADLSEIPADRLIGSDALARVLELAAIHGKARDEKLRWLAEREISRRDAA